jgi:hypothetical protein
MNGGTLHHALEAGGGLRIAAAFRHQPGQILVQKFGQVAFQFININTAGAQHTRCIGIITKRQQQMFQRCVLMSALTSQGQGAMQRLF